MPVTIVLRQNLRPTGGRDEAESFCGGADLRMLRGNHSVTGGPCQKIHENLTAEIAENAECTVRTAVRTMHLLCELCALRGELVFCNLLA